MLANQRVFCFAFLLVMFAHAYGAGGDDREGFFSFLPKEDVPEARRYFGHIEAPCTARQGLTAEQQCSQVIQPLLDKLKTECQKIDSPCQPGVELMQQLFGHTYRSVLPDYILYFRQDHRDGRIHFSAHTPPVLIWRGMNTPHLYGVRDVYVVVFTEKKACLDAFVTTEYKSEPNPFSAVLGLLGGKEPAQSKPNDTQQKGTFTWYPLSGDPADSPMWFGISGVKVDVNSSNRITVRYVQPTTGKADAKSESSPPEECKDPNPGHKDGVPKYTGDFGAANAFFSNSPDSWVTVAFALGLTTNTHDTSVSSGGSNRSFNGYAMAKFFLPGNRPQLRAGPGSVGHTRSLGVVVGTNLTHSPFDELLVGVSWGHLVGNVGLVVGLNSVAGKKDTAQGRQQRPFIGLDYSF